MERSEYATDLGPIDAACDCFVCKKYTKSYIHHLFRSKEMLAGVLASAHNMRFLTRLTENIRSAILEDRLSEYAREFLGEYKK